MIAHRPISRAVPRFPRKSHPEPLLPGAGSEMGRMLGLLHRHADQPAVLATLTRVSGSSYRKPGARLLWFPDGTRTGSISGGCLEEDVITHAKNVLRSGNPETITYNTAAENDLVWGTGTGCEGEITLLLELIPVERPQWLEELAKNFRSNQLTKLEVLDEGTVLGTHLADSASATGGVRDVIPPPQRLIVFGAGDDAQPLVAMATTLGWDILVADSRPAYATRARFPAALELHAGPAANVWEIIAADPATPLVIMTHRYRDDRILLPLALAHANRYVGLLGPRKRAERLLNEMAAEGFKFTAAMQRVLHAPIGLNLGGSTPASVALAILAEVQACLAEAAPTPLRDRSGRIHEELAAVHLT